MHNAIDLSFNDQLHNLACVQNPPNVDNVAFFNMLTEIKDTLVELEHDLSMGAIFFSDELSKDSQLYVAGNYQAALSFAKDTRIAIDSDRSPNATVFFSPPLAPRITVSLGLIEGICNATAPPESAESLKRYIDEEAERIQSIFDERSIGGLERFQIFWNVMLNLNLNQMRSASSNSEFLQAFYFVIAHELAHILFDHYQSDDISDISLQIFYELRGGSPGVVPRAQIGDILKEVRADFYALVQNELIFGNRRQSEMKSKELRTQLSTQWNMSEIVGEISAPGHEVIINLLYREIGFKEPEIPVHLRPDDRLEFVTELYKRIGTNNGEKFND